MNNADQKEIVTREVAALGFGVIYWNEKPSANGPDCWIQKPRRRPLSVEVKLVRKKKNGQFVCDPVSKPRQSDDIIAVIVNSEYVLIEPMRDHFKACSPTGVRSFTLIKNGSES